MKLLLLITLTIIAIPASAGDTVAPITQDLNIVEKDMQANPKTKLERALIAFKKKTKEKQQAVDK